MSFKKSLKKRNRNLLVDMGGINTEHLTLDKAMVVCSRLGKGVSWFARGTEWFFTLGRGSNFFESWITHFALKLCFTHKEHNFESKEEKEKKYMVCIIERDNEGVHMYLESEADQCRSSHSNLEKVCDTLEWREEWAERKIDFNEVINFAKSENERPYNLLFNNCKH
eukprot:Pgem_evm1s7681